MLKRLKIMALTTRVWLSAGVFCFGLSVVLGYHEDQVVAHNALVEKVGLPPMVLIQDFDQGRHSNLLSEAQLLGEVALSMTTTINIGTEAAPNWVQLAPIYPVGAGSLPLASKFLADLTEGPRRPMPRAQHVKLQAKAQRILPLEKQPMALVLIDSDMSIEEAILFRRIGQGMQGPLVAITGSLLINSNFQKQAAAAFSDREVQVIESMPFVVPYENGRRVTGPSLNYETWRNTLEWMAVLLVLVGVANAFKLPQKLKPNPQPQPVFERVEAIGAFPGVFQAIRTQEELVREEQEESERKAAASRRAFSRMNYQ